MLIDFIILKMAIAFAGISGNTILFLSLINISLKDAITMENI